MAVAQQRTAQQPADSHAGPVDQATLRRVAIVLSGLPASVANRLMGNLAGETKHRIREEIRNLSDVDPFERHRAYQAFTGSFRKQQPGYPAGTSRHVSNAGDTFDAGGTRSSETSESISQVYRMDESQTLDPVKEYSPAETLTANDDTPRARNLRPEMTFLGDIDDDVLSRVIEGEHPQAIAFVLASIAPAQAARIVTALEPELQSEALNRIARLDEASGDVIADFASHLRRKVERFGASSCLPGGRRAVQAILDAMPSRETAEMDARIPGDQPNRSNARQMPHASAERSSVVDEVVTPRIAPETLSEPTAKAVTANQPGESKPPSRSARPATEPPPTASSTFDSTDAIHEHLVNMKPQALCRALAEVDTRQALLTLCGLPNDVAEKILAALPRSQAKQVRAKLGSLGSLQLREIDEAKELVANVSIGWNPDENTRSIDHRVDAVHPMPIAA